MSEHKIEYSIRVYPASHAGRVFFQWVVSHSWGRTRVIDKAGEAAYEAASKWVQR